MEFPRPELVKQMFKERLCKHQNLAVHKSEGSQAVYRHITREKAKMITGRDKALPLEDLYPRLVCVCVCVIYIYIYIYIYRLGAGDSSCSFLHGL